jgi:hypothetical protein
MAIFYVLITSRGFGSLCIKVKSRDPVRTASFCDFGTEQTFCRLRGEQLSLGFNCLRDTILHRENFSILSRFVWYSTRGNHKLSDSLINASTRGKLNGSPQTLATD